MVDRKYIKVKTDMYSDTKFKIIDTMDDRDLIHYIWTRLLTLAGKVNLEGALYMSRNIPYTLETLAIEFNRSTSKVKLALKVFKDLEMIELDENNVYKVKNFAKHQNIKSKKNIEKSDNEKKSNEKINIEKLAHKNKANNDIINNNFNTKDCKLEVNNDKNFINDKCLKDKVNFEKNYKESEKFNNYLLNNEVKTEVKNEECKVKEFKGSKNNENRIFKDNKITICKDLNEKTVFKDGKSAIYEDNERAVCKDSENSICKDNNLYIGNEREKKVKLEEIISKNQNKNLCKNKSKNDKCKVKEFKNTNKKESKDIDFNINLNGNNKQKKSKKSKKKSEDIEELCFEELLSEEDVIKPIEWKDEPILKGEIIKEFNF